MLELKNITKTYQLSGSRVEALRGISLAFRNNEFVAILGHSGCGKTTLLNIIGGLDQYTSGDLNINGISTKRFKDRDWDTYRNHTVGFIFQSYNLIPHQSVLANVELALTISGVSHGERRRRAREALEKVGLGDQLHKKPNQMSGGQMQRVAIARALVNNPDILLADEPTGALDSETSLQVMELIREIAKDKLVVMVTHNPELAQQYATRIVCIKDGLITGDSNPYYPEKETQKPQAQPFRRVSMSFPTALSLSFHNLLTKKGRTFMTSFAGSIGIIGIALILSLSNGINRYIAKVQEDTLSSYPIQIEAETTDTAALMSSFMDAHAESAEEEAQTKDAVYSNTVMYDMFNRMVSAETTSNNLEKLKEFLDSDAEISQYASAIQYTYSVPMTIYTQDAAGKIIQSDFSDLMTQAMGTQDTTLGGMQASMFSDMNLWEEMLSDGDGMASDLLKEQYDLLYGAWPERYDQVVLVVNKRNEISDLMLYALGFKDTARLPDIVDAAMTGNPIEDAGEEAWSYKEICQKEYRLILPIEQWQYNTSSGNYTDMSLTDSGMEYLYHADTVGIPLKIVGIIRPNEEAAASMLTGAVGYTQALKEYVMEQTENSAIVKAQKEEETIDVFTGLPFLTEETKLPDDKEKARRFQEYAQTLSTSDKAEIYAYIQSVPDAQYVDQLIEQQLSGLTREQVEQQVMEQYASNMGVDTATVQGYISEMDDETLFGKVEEAMRQTIQEEYAQQMAENLSSATAEQLAKMFDAAQWVDSQYGLMYDRFMPPAYSQATLEENYTLLGVADKEKPSGVNLYAATFSDKDRISDRIAAYNDMAEEGDKITYTDYVALLMSSITGIISGVSYLLIAFVGISLVVSSIMIGIITYISVLERTREIGILRAMGASKGDVSNVFNAETLIIGFVSGVIGIGISLLLNLPINAIIHQATGIVNLNASLPVAGGIILVMISMVLTLIAGLIPSRYAAKKDPVEALRTE